MLSEEAQSVVVCLAVLLVLGVAGGLVYLARRNPAVEQVNAWLSFCRGTSYPNRGANHHASAVRPWQNPASSFAVSDLAAQQLRGEDVPETASEVATDTTSDGSDRRRGSDNDDDDGDDNDAGGAEEEEELSELSQ